MSRRRAGGQPPLLGVAAATGERSFFLAEGPTWDPTRGELRWVDIFRGTVHRGILGPHDRIQELGHVALGEPVGALAVAADGELLVAGSHRLHAIGRDDAVRSSRPLLEGDGRRFNDGKPDPAGRFVVGTAGTGRGELLLRVEADGSTTVLDDDLTLSNGLTWSADGTRLYSADTLTRRIFVRDYDAATGEAGARRTFLTLAEGAPDGMTTDADDHLWVAVWGGGCVLRVSPSGDIVGRIAVPAPHVSSAAFAGPDLDVLVITTARESLTSAQLAADPDSGRLFTCRPGISGAPTAFWSGVLPSHTPTTT